MLSAHATFRRVCSHQRAAIGKLYFRNTLGAAFGCLGTAFVLFIYFDLYQVIWMAAASNFIVAILAYVEGRRYV